jgi:hypothetical protein
VQAFPSDLIRKQSGGVEVIEVDGQQLSRSSHAHQGRFREEEDERSACLIGWVCGSSAVRDFHAEPPEQAV